MFSLRIVATDHYLCPPIPELDVQYSDLTQSEIWRVPVIRVYGSTPSGQKTCMHVHGVFPYLYVPYDGTQPWDRYLKLFAKSLDKALNVSLNKVNSNTQHVYKINLVSGIPMYGYHEKEEQFLKIFLYNPRMVRKAADLLLGGAVMNKAFQPHEAHIPYILQMFIDYNLYGMNMINVCAVKFRKQKTDECESCYIPRMQKTKESEESSQWTPTSLFDRTEMVTPSRKTWDISNIQEELLLDESITRQSTCELECDVVAPDILNRQEVDDKIGINPGLAALWEDEKQRKRNMGEPSQITPPDSQERENLEISESDQMLRLKFLQIIQDQKPYIDSQTEEESQGSVKDSSQASAIDMQLSEEGLENSSLDTVIVEEDEMIPVISVDSIKRVVSMSQSFSTSQPPQANSQDKSLADILASLADENCSSSSQEIAQQITALEEGDSILLDKSQHIDDEDDKQQEEETLEMTQVVFDDMDKNEDSSNQQEEMMIPISRSVDFNLEGLDDTWNMSQFLKKDAEDETDGDIPQFDGVGDELEKETEAEKNLRKPFFSNQVPTRNIGNISYTQSLGSNSQNENADQISSQSQNETIPATVSSRKRYREDRKVPVNSEHCFDNFGNIVSSHQTGNDIHKGNVNLHSLSQINSSQSRLGNNSNHSKINLLHTSTHDNDHGCKQSPIHSSQNKMQEPTSSTGSLCCIKSPVNEDNIRSFQSMNAQSLFRMTPSPEKDNFTVHHYSQDSLQGSKEIGSIQEQMLQCHNNHGYHRNIQLPSLNDPMLQSQFHMSNVNQYDSIKGHPIENQHSSYRQYPATSNVQSFCQPVVNNSLQTGYQMDSGSQKTLPGSHYKRSQNGILSSRSDLQMPHTPSYKIPQEQQMQKSSENILFTPVNLQTSLLPQSFSIQQDQFGSIVPSQITKGHLIDCNNQNNQSDQHFSATNALGNLQISQVLPMNEQHNVHNIQYTLPVSSNDQFYMLSHVNSVDNLHEYSHGKVLQTSSTGRNVSLSSLTPVKQHSGSNSNHFQEKSFCQLMTEDEYLSKQDNSEDNICFPNSQLSENTTNFKSKPYTKLIPKCHQYIGQSSHQQLCLPSNSKPFLGELSKNKRIHICANIEQKRREEKNLAGFSQTLSLPVVSKHQSINSSLQAAITEDLEKKQEKSVIHQTHKEQHNSSYRQKHSGMQPMQHNPKANELSKSTNIGQNLQRIPSASTIMHENIKKSTTIKNKINSSKNFPSKNEPSTLERLLLYGDDNSNVETSSKESFAENATEDYLQSSLTNQSPDLFFDSSQSSSSQRAYSQAQTNCESSVKKNINKNERSEKKNTLSSLETLVKNVRQGSSFGYQYDSPVRNHDSYMFDPFSVSDTNNRCNTTKSSSYTWKKSPVHNYDSESPSDYSHPKFSNLYDGSKSPNQFCGYKSHSQFGSKSLSHVGIGRSLSYSGSLHYDNFNSMDTSKDQNKIYLHDRIQHPLDLNHTSSGYSKNVKKQKAALKRSHSFTFEKRVQQGTRTNSIQQMKPHSDVKSKKPLTPNRAYSFTFHLPTPFYKKLKFKNEKQLKHDISVVRMHPMDARRYSLLKIGRGIVKVKKLTQIDIDKSGIVLKASLEELLRTVVNDQKHSCRFCQKCVQNSKMKSPYDIKTQDVKFVNEINVSNKKESLISKKHKSLTSMANIYPETMIAPPAQTLDASSKDCHSIQKVTLTSIIENVLLTSIRKDNEEETTNTTVINNDLLHTVTGSSTSSHWKGNDQQSMEYFMSHKFENNGNCNKNVSHEEKKDSKSTSPNQSHQAISNFEEKELVGYSGLDKLMLYNKCSPDSKNLSSGKFDSSLLEANLSGNDKQFCENSEKTFSKIRNCLASVKHISGNLSANMMFPTHNLSCPNGNSEKEKIGSIKELITPNIALNNYGHESKKLAKQHPQKNSMLCSKCSMDKMLTSSPTVIDDESVILKDVSLTDASDGLLTPNVSKSRTPVAGGSPVSQQNVDAYKLFDGETLDFKDDFDNKFKDLNHYVRKSEITGANTKTEKENSYIAKRVVESLDTASSGSNSGKNKDDMYSVLTVTGRTKSSVNLTDKSRIAGFLENEEFVASEKFLDHNSIKCLERVHTYPYTTKPGKANIENEVIPLNSLTFESVPIKRKLANMADLKGSDWSNMQEKETYTYSELPDVNEIIQKYVQGVEFKTQAPKGNYLTAGCKRQKLLANLTVTYGPAKWKKKVKSHEISNVSSESLDDDFLHHSDILSPEKENDVQNIEQKRLCGYYQGFTIDWNGKPYKRKPSLSMNRKLQVAFLSKKAKRKKQVKHASKIRKIPKSILGLSLLHEATLANLTESKSSNEADLAETDSEFDDILSKMALYSSPETDSLDSLPPQPFSPEELSYDLQSTSSSEYSNISTFADGECLDKYKKISHKKESSNLEMKTSEISYVCDTDNSESLLNESFNIDGFSNFDEQHFSKSDCCKIKKKAVVRLNRLSVYEIEKYKREKQNTETEQENSPPGLSPPNITQYPKNGSGSHYRNEENHTEQSHIYPTDSCNTEYGDLKSLSEPTLITADKIINVQLLKSGETQDGRKIMEISMPKLVTDDIANINPVYLKETESLQALVKDDVCELLQHNLICASDYRVFTSKALPPSKKHVTDSALLLNLNQANNQNAFCSNPDDLPEKPKELGGRKLSIESFQLSELAEFKSHLWSDNIAKWRGFICPADDYFINSGDILDKIDKDRKLHFSIVGDEHVTITPCKPVPLCKNIRDWKTGRQVYKQMTVKERNKVGIKRQEQIEFKNIQKLQQICHSMKPNKSVSFSVQYCEKMSSSSKASRTCEKRMKSNIDENNITYDSSKDDAEDDIIGPSPPDVTPSIRNINHISQNRLFSSQPGLLYSPYFSDGHQALHSTPLTKVRNDDLVLPACTPINHLKKVAPLSRREAVNTRKGELSIELQQYATPVQKRNVSQIDGPTPKNSFGFQISQQNFHDAKALHEVQNLTVFSMELLADSRGDLFSDPEIDAIKAIFYTIHNDVNSEKGPKDITGLIMVDAESTKIQEELRNSAKSKESSHLSTCNNQNPSTSRDTTSSSLRPLSKFVSHEPSNLKDNKRNFTPLLKDTVKSDQLSKLQTNTSFSGVHLNQTLLQKSGIDENLQVVYVETEMGLFNEFKDLITRWDPDLLVGYEIQKSSWGYLLQRAAQVGIDLCSQISRIPEEKRASHFSAEKDEYGADNMSEIHIVGRIVINLWRIMRHEVTLNIYTFENVIYHVLHQRTPKYSFRILNTWYNKKTHHHSTELNQ
ncbi:uncharacterized protein LOC127724637 isoform X3 [Mytilus californianus]|uniref:uncharacterized protein LOC127724637 isoform X3 n=1 Tax=Mytilus californianus TaxID=6549 RepID=UPI0022460964|nr:uncharacterized protein LOC127724637 isoform X3 [Mytilus californianus]